MHFCLSQISLSLAFWNTHFPKRCFLGHSSSSCPSPMGSNTQNLNLKKKELLLT